MVRGLTRSSSLADRLRRLVGGGERPLSDPERALLPAPLARAVDLARVRIKRRYHNPLAAIRRLTVVRGYDVYWAEAPAEATTALERAHLAHELVHVWQYKAKGRSGVSILMERAYRYELRTGLRFADLGAEQQASLVEDLVRLRAGLPPRWTSTSGGASAGLPAYDAVIASAG